MRCRSAARRAATAPPRCRATTATPRLWKSSKEPPRSMKTFSAGSSLVNYNVPIQQLIEARVAAQPQATAVLCGGESLSYAELNARANQLAHRLRAEGVGPGAIVALMVERSVAMMVGILGVMKAGGAYLPVPPDNPAERTRYMLDDGGVKILLVHGKTAGRFAFSGLTLNLDAALEGETANPVLLNKLDDLVYVIYTSGS